MVKDRFGQEIGPGDVVVDVDCGGWLRVVTTIWGERSVQVHWLSGAFSELRMFATVDPAELFRISDISDFDLPSQDEVRELEDLYMTITGERYG